MPHPFARRTLASLKKDARRWLAALAAGEPEARARLRRILPDAPDAPTLRDVQLALAREQGFDGWTALKRALEPDPARSAATLAQYDDMAEALLDAYRTGTPEAMERHYRYTWHRRAWSGMRSYVQLDLGKRPSEPDGDVAISLDDARWLVARERGFDSWEALRASRRQPAWRRAARHHRRAGEGAGAARGARARRRHRPRSQRRARHRRRRPRRHRTPDAARTPRPVGHVDHRRRRRAPARLRRAARREPRVDGHRRRRAPRARRQAAPAHVPQRQRRHRRRASRCCTSGRSSRPGRAAPEHIALAGLRRRRRTFSGCAARSPIAASSICAASTACSR